jgi:hypothetical protein
MPSEIMVRESRTKSLRDGGDRVARIARWLSRPPPKDAVVLRLYVTASEETDLLQEWPIKLVNIELAPEIDDLIRMAAEEYRQQVRAKTSWCDEAGHALITQSYVCNPECISTTVAELDGGNKSVAIQLQRHYEASQRLSFGIVGDVVGHYGTLTERAFAELARRDAEKERLLARCEELERSLAGWEGIAKEAAEAAERATEQAATMSGSSRLDKYVEMFGPMLKAHLEKQTPANTNGTKPS